MQLFICHNVGIDGLTDVFVKEDEGVFTARMGFALFGNSNMSEEQLEACDYNPFHDDFYDNYVQGLGSSRDEAVDNMKKNMKGISDSLWDE